MSATLGIHILTATCILTIQLLRFRWCLKAWREFKKKSLSNDIAAMSLLLSDFRSNISSSLKHCLKKAVYRGKIVSWLVFNGTFSTNTLYRAIGVWNRVRRQHEHIVRSNNKTTRKS